MSLQYGSACHDPGDEMSVILVVLLCVAFPLSTFWLGYKLGALPAKIDDELKRK